MAKLEDCTHMMLYEVSFSDIELIGSKIIGCLYLSDGQKIVKRLGVSATNLPKMLKAFELRTMSELNRKMIRCAINEFGEIEYIALIESMSEDDWIYCKDLHLRL